MWGSAHCVQVSLVKVDPTRVPTRRFARAPCPFLPARPQVSTEQIMSLGEMGRDCVATDQLPLSRVCHCITATLATLASNPDTADLIMTCPGDLALSTLLLLVEVREGKRGGGKWACGAARGLARQEAEAA